MTPALQKSALILALLLAAPLALATFNFLRENYLTPSYSETEVLSESRVGGGPRTGVLLHGLAGSKSYWVGRTAPLHQSFTLHEIDLIGFGSSPKPRGDYGYPMHLDSIERTLRARGILAPDVIVAHSMGALIGIELARRVHPKTLILMAPPIFKTKNEAIDSLGAVSFMHRGMVENSTLLKLSCFIRDAYRLPILARLFGLPEDVYMEGTRHTWNSLSQSLRAIIVEQPKFQPLPPPTKVMIIHARDDKVAPFAGGQALSEEIGATMIAVDSGGHNFFLSNKQPLYTALDDSDGED